MPDPTTETWTYIGRREIRSGKLAVYFIDGEGEQRGFMAAKVKAGTIGGLYEVKVDRNGENVSVIGQPSFVDEGNDPRIPEWAAEDRAAYTADAQRKREAKAKATDGFGDLTLREAAHLFEGLPPGQGPAFVAQVIQYLNRGRNAT